MGSQCGLIGEPQTSEKPGEGDSKQGVCVREREMSQQERVLGNKPDNLNLIP